MSKARCILCDDVMESKHRYDFVRCACGKSFLDGGDNYVRGTMTTILIREEEDGEKEES